MAQSSRTKNRMLVSTNSERIAFVIVCLEYVFLGQAGLPSKKCIGASDRYSHSKSTGGRSPIPEYTRDYFELAQKLLKDGSGADVLNIDLIWSPILAADLIRYRMRNTVGFHERLLGGESTENRSPRKSLSPLTRPIKA